MSGCVPTAATGGKGTSVSKTGKGTTGTSTTTWATKHGTTKISYSYKIVPAAQQKCGTGKAEIIETGKVLSSSGLAAKVIKAGQPTSADVCLNPKTNGLSLRKGTKYTF